MVWMGDSMFVRLSRLAAAAAVFFVALGASAAPLPVEAFASLPDVESVTVSPSGRYIALVGAAGDQKMLTVFDTASNQRVGSIPSGKALIYAVDWVSDDRLLMTAAVIDDINIPGRDITYNNCRIIAVNRDGSNPKAFDCLANRLLSVKGPEPDTILMGGFNFGAGSRTADKTATRAANDVYAANVITGDVKVVERGNRNTTSWVADASGQVRIRVDREGSRVVYFVRASGGTDWVEAGSENAIDFEPGDSAVSAPLSFRGFGDNPNEVYAVSDSGDKSTLVVYDLAQRQVSRTVLSDGKWDVGGFLRERTGRIVGGSIVRWNLEQEFFVPEWKTLKQEMDSNFPGHRVQIRSASDDRKKLVVYLEGPQAPGGAFQYIDLERGDGFTVGSRYPKVTQANVGQVETITYQARDGQSIDAYVTYPASGKRQGMAGIVMPHGGPQARDNGGFDYWSQFLANRGYVVLQPQFRGSDGYGKSFAGKGRGEWGKKMQDDVTDGVKYLVAQGVLDSNRVCILGWSYGGYAAGAGATLTPELYRCAVAGAGVFDLPQIFDEVARDQGGSASLSYRYWKRHIGTDRALMQAVSPARLAQNVRAPILLLHGDKDTVVNIEQSETMAAALKQAGKPYEFVRLAGENHNLAFARTRLEAFRAWEAFLLKHNPPN